MAEPPFGHESSAVATRSVLQLLAIIAIAVIVSVTVLGVVFNDWIAPNQAQGAARRAAVPPPPRLQPDPQGDLQDLRTQKQQLLSGWGWVDSSHDFARIPIERAMALYVEQQAGGRSAAASSGAGAPAQHVHR